MLSPLVLNKSWKQGRGMYPFIYSSFARLVSFEIQLILKESSRAEPEYMNIYPPRRLAF